jgi:hypothetical protein
MPAQDITVTATFKNTFSISGTVTGDVIEGVIVTASDGATTQTGTTDATGAFTISDLHDGTYTVIPVLSGYFFTPVNTTITISGNDQTITTPFTSTSNNGNNPPVAANDSYNINVDETLDVPKQSGVLANDVDLDGDELMAKIVTPINGVTLDPNGGFKYSATAAGTFTFSYIAIDEKGAASNITAVEINVVTGTTVPPTAVGDKYDVAKNSVKFVSIEKGVLVNDLNAVDVTLSLSKPAANGQVTLNPNGSFEYTPNDNFADIDTFEYQITDGTTTSTAIVALNVAPVNITLGSVLTYTATDVRELEGEVFPKAPKLYGVFVENGKKGSFKKIKSSTGSVFSGAWNTKLTLYNKKAVKGGYKSYYDSNGPDTPAVITVMVKGKTDDGQKIDSEIQKIQIVPPVITAILHSNGDAIAEDNPASLGETITIEGKYFGDKAPKVALEVNGKLAKCKVDKDGLSNTNYKGKPSAMDPATGKSSIKVILPSKKVSEGTYPIVLDNKVGIATTAVENGTLPVITIKE